MSVRPRNEETTEIQSHALNLGLQHLSRVTEILEAWITKKYAVILFSQAFIFIKISWMKAWYMIKNPAADNP